MRTRSRFRRLFKTIAGALLALLCLGIAGLGMLQTGFGKRIAAASCAHLLSGASHTTVVLDGLDGTLPWDVRVKTIAMQDARGDCFAVEGFALRWSPLQLIHGRYRIFEASAEVVHFWRLPQGRHEDKGLQPRNPDGLARTLQRLRVDRLVLSRVVLETPVWSEKPEFRISGDFAHAATADESRSSLRAESLRGAQAEVQATVLLRNDLSRLDVDIEYSEPAGGLAMTALKLRHDGPVRVSFHGSGSPADWQGTVEARVGDSGSLDARVRMDMTEEAALAVEGTVHVPEQWIPTPWAAFTGTDGRFQVTARGDSFEKVSVEKASLSMETGSVELNGNLDLSSRSASLGFRADLAGPAVLACITGLALDNPIVATGTIEGPLRQPRMAADVTLQTPRFQAARADRVSIHVDAETLGPMTRGFPGVRIRGNGKAQGFEYGSRRAYVPADFNWSADVEIPDRQSVHVASLSVENDNLCMTSSGHVALPALTVDLDASLAVPNLRRFPFPEESWPDGAAEVRAEVKGDLRTRLISAALTGSLHDLSGLPAPGPDLAGDTVTFAGSLDFRNGREVSVEAFRAETKHATLQGRGSWNTAERRLESSAQLSIPEVNVLSKFAKCPVSGSLHVDGQLGGAWPHLKAEVKTECRDFVVAKFRTDAVTGALVVNDVLKEAAGHFVATISNRGERISAKGNVDQRGHVLRLSSIEVNTPGGTITGAGQFDVSKKVVESALQAELNDLAWIGGLVNEPINGRATLRATFQATGAGQELVANVEGRSLETRFGHAEKVRIEADISDLFRSPRGKVRAELQEARRGGLALNDATLALDGTADRASFEASLHGRYGDPFSLETHGNAARTENQVACELSAARGTWGECPAAFDRPVRITWTGNQLDVDGVAVSVQNGRFEGRAVLAREKVDVDASFDRLPVERARAKGEPLLTGQASGRIQLRGALDDVEGDLRIELADLRPANPALKDFPAASITVASALKDGVLRVDLKDNGGLLGNPIEGAAAISVRVSLAPVKVVVQDTANIEGRLSCQTDLDRIATLLAVDGQHVRGALKATLGLSGTPARPAITGQAILRDGAYEHYGLGTVLRDMQATLTGSGSRLEIVDASATDGGNGAVTVKGWIDLAPARGFPLEASVAIHDATLVRRDDATVAFNGQAAVSGGLMDPKISGDLRIDPANIQIPDRQTPPMAALEVVGRNAPPTVGAPSAPPKPARIRGLAQKASLDLHVDSPGRVFVRGRGLESAWQCDLRVGGTVGQPAITGRTTLVKGRVLFLGKQFTLTKGDIGFNGQWPPQPAIDVTSEAAAKDMTAFFNVKGTPAALEVDLESDPPAPRDEILAYLLFGRSIAHISPVEALEIAEAARMLSGGPGLLRITERARRILRLDELSLIQGDEELRDSSVAVGKYLGKDVYVGVEQSTTSKKGKVQAQIDLTPNLSLQGEAGRDEKSGIGLKWKKDY